MSSPYTGLQLPARRRAPGLGPVASLFLNWLRSGDRGEAEPVEDRPHELAEIAQTVPHDRLQDRGIEPPVFMDRHIPKARHTTHAFREGGIEEARLLEKGETRTE